MDRRVAPPRDLEGLLDELTEQPLGLFETKQKALMFASALGKRLGRRTPVDRRGVGIRVDIFENAHDDGFLNALAVAESGDLRLLGEDRVEERIRIFEEYAHTGLLHIRDRADGDRLDSLLNWALDAASAGLPSESDVDPDVLRDLSL